MNEGVNESRRSLVQREVSSKNSIDLLFKLLLSILQGILLRIYGSLNTLQGMSSTRIRMKKLLCVV